MNLKSLSAGPDLVRALQRAYEADQPILLIGERGVGKSALVEQAANDLGIGFICCDLSMMEPTDLAGLPKIRADGRTHYAPPAFLPSSGDGFLMFEELNRCPAYMRAPCLELCTRRRRRTSPRPPPQCSGTLVFDQRGQKACPVGAHCGNAPLSAQGHLRPSQRPPSTATLAAETNKLRGSVGQRHIGADAPDIQARRASECVSP